MHDIDKNLFLDILNKHGADKILFATDSPWRDILKEVNLIKSLVGDKEILDKILYKNAKKLLNV